MKIWFAIQGPELHKNLFQKELSTGTFEFLWLMM